MNHRTCTIEGCSRKHSGRGWCTYHYGKWRKTGDPTYATPTYFERLFGKIHFADCWEWQGSKDQNGYGTFFARPGKWQKPHRAVWEYLVGELSDDVQLDHLCRNRVCCNPDHLEPVPAWVNNMRSYSPSAFHLRKEFCPKGHQYDEENTYWRPDGKGRYCRQCRKLTDQRRVRAARASVVAPVPA